MSFYDEHMTESKQLLQAKANEILLTKEDYEGERVMFAPIKRMASNAIISEHVTDLANVRLESFRNLCPDVEQSRKYKEELVDYLRGLYKKKL